MLLYLILLAAGLAFGFALGTGASLNRWTWTPLIALASAFVVDRIAGHTSRGKALRPVVGKQNRDDEEVPDPPEGLERWRRWYIEDPEARVSCSFVEFDERGDHLDFDQHRHAYQKTMTLATQGPLVLVVF